VGYSRDGGDSVDDGVGVGDGDGDRKDVGRVVRYCTLQRSGRTSSTGSN